MELLDNKTQGKVIDKLKEDLKSGTKLSIISAYFTIFAYQELRKELNKIDSLRLLFSMFIFIKLIFKYFYSSVFLVKITIFFLCLFDY